MLRQGGGSLPRPSLARTRVSILNAPSVRGVRTPKRRVAFMTDTALDEKRIRDEAAGWYAKLNNTTISTETLRALREWRKDEWHADAYAEIDAVWQRADKLRDDHEIQRAAGEALAKKKTPLGPPRWRRASLFSSFQQSPGCSPPSFVRARPSMGWAMLMTRTAEP